LDYKQMEANSMSRDIILAQRLRISELEAALRNVMIGGNHVALLIGADHPPAEATCDMALEFYGPGEKYEAWCCWQAIMRARRVLENE
jgi:hypothetical protein